MHGDDGRHGTTAPSVPIWRRLVVAYEFPSDGFAGLLAMPSVLPHTPVRPRRSTSSVVVPEEGGEKDEQTPEENTNQWTPAQRSRILVLVSSPAILGPMSTTMYIPAMNDIGDDLHASDLAVVSTISVYALVLGFMPLIWGPASDSFGRRKVLVWAMFAYAIATFLCGWSSSIALLIVFRALQAIGVASLVSVGAGVIADVFPIDVRGRAMGTYSIGPLLGPVLGPLFGGLVAEALGWRAIFFILAGAGVICWIMVFHLLPETLPVDRRSQEFPKPWRPLLLLRRRSILLMMCLLSALFSGMYSMVVTLPDILEDDYGLNSFETGIVMIPFGVGTLAGSVSGGRACDFFEQRFGSHYRLVPSIFGSLVNAVALCAFGWTASVSIALIIVTSLCIGFSLTFTRPGALTYSIAKAPGQASSVAGLMISFQFTLAGILILGSTVVVESLGLGVVAIFFACVSLVLTALTAKMVIAHPVVLSDTTLEDGATTGGSGIEDHTSMTPLALSVATPTPDEVEENNNGTTPLETPS